ncbi:MazG-like family protein [Paenactinomyces guangxiensis]|uniref:MazG-like family protein n=1 Tax=Paenactinomyces guangxiensis TaxID=1490290 RepID=A0A7W1WQ93_9BACL|nr:MazG-like family protein [Paenactinomyces guangxiensis]MBA4494091.1 MazG-like family protein [Paenactinomyces guangxiensis]MBH8591164.1 MazG-like family protein [Paenactinomyces guangxiensis]
MSRPERGVQFAKSVKIIEWLKTEILDQIAHLFKGIHHANQHVIIDSLSSLIVSTYVLARRIGFSYRELDQAVVQKLREHTLEGHQLEEWYGDLSTLEEYLNKR